MATTENPLLKPIRDSFLHKRSQKTGLVSPNWLLAVLVVLDFLRQTNLPVPEDDIYTYDFSLKKSRGKAIVSLLEKYGFPPNPGISREGVTTRGAPGFRILRDVGFGLAIAGVDQDSRNLLLDAAVELVRTEMIRFLGRDPISLPEHRLGSVGLFVQSLLEAVENRSNGRVEQAIVGAKLQLRFPEIEVPNERAFAGDRQTGRDCDFEVGELRVIVSVSPKPQHFDVVRQLVDCGKEVVLVVSEKHLRSATGHIMKWKLPDPPQVASVYGYIKSNLTEISVAKQISKSEMCQKLIVEYNRRVEVENDPSLRVVLPTKSEAAT